MSLKDWPEAGTNEGGACPFCGGDWIATAIPGVFCCHECEAIAGSPRNVIPRQGVGS